ncbi:MAG: radical SAM protein, partial [Anaerolineae bacterium]
MKWATIAATKRILTHEQGTVIKDWGGKLPIALLYPNTYYVGMSSLAVQTLYHLLNARPDIVCERVFCGYRRLQCSPAPLSLETQRPLAEFGVLAVTFSFELDYLNFVAVLHSAGIPPLAAERDESFPFLLAGGPAVSANPEPLAELCDAFVIGEVEEILPHLLDT